MNTLLWIGQIFLAVVFFYSGLCKSVCSEQWLVAHNQTGVEGLPHPFIRVIGLLELLGVAGILLPRLTGIYPALTGITAIAFALIMLLAAPIHYRRGEIKSVAFNGFIFLVAVFVAWYAV